MKVISEGQELIIKLLYVPKKENQLYRLNNCLISEVVPNGLLLCNPITSELILLSNEERSYLNSLPGDAPVQLSFLIEHNFIVPLDYNEKQIVDQLRTIIWKRLGNYYRGYVILPTTYCNARCFYCYESGFKHICMSDETAIKLIDFIAEHYDGKGIKISWFGGEPLLGRRTINFICSELKKRNISYISKMVSNGYLFDKQIIREAIDLWNLSVVQITLDGTEEVYNQTKAYVGISDSAYRRVLSNVKDLLNNDISVIIRLNLDKHNKHNLLELIKELADTIDNRQLLTIYASVLNENAGYSPLKHEPGEIDELWKYLSVLDKALVDNHLKGKVQKLPGLNINSCMADGNDQLVCTPNGILGKCEHYLDQYPVGNIIEGINDNSRLQWWKERNEYDECNTCPLLAECIKLKNCPVNRQYCVKSEKKAKINHYQTVMRMIYASKMDHS